MWEIAMFSRADVVEKKAPLVQHEWLSLLQLSSMNCRASIARLALMGSCLLFSSPAAHAEIQTAVVDNYEFTWVTHENGQYHWDDVISFDEVLELPGLANSPAYLMALPYDYTAFKRTPAFIYDLAYLERVGEPPNDEWHMTSHRYLEDYVPTLDTWIDIIRSENHLDITPAVPIGLLVNVTAVPEPATLLLALLALTAMPMRTQRR
jgi:hypothetical protein